jgi:cobalt-zinc-cadmium efflux system protein
VSSAHDGSSGHGGHGGHGHGVPAAEPRRELPAAADPHAEHGGHGHGHGHGHGGHGADSSSSALTWALVLTASFMVLEAAAGVWTHGLALLADAGHMFADAASLGLALVAAEWAKRPRTAKSTFGHRRAEVLAAFVNGIALAVTAIAVVVEAVERWQSPQEIRAGAMLVAATVGLAMNGVVALILARSGGSNANMRAAIAHVLTDALGSVGAMSAAALVLFFGWHRADAVVSVLIAVLVAFSGWRVIRETTSILLEAAPGHIDVVEVEKMIKGCPGVGGVHDLHVWRISDAFDALTVHVTLASGVHGVDVCRDVARKLETTFGLAHVTVQPEAPPPMEVVRIRAGKDGRLLNSP